MSIVEPQGRSLLKVSGDACYSEKGEDKVCIIPMGPACHPYTRGGLSKEWQHTQRSELS